MPEASKKRLIIFSVAIMAFLAMPLLRVSAVSASATASGNLGEYKVYGAVNIDEGSANANAGSDYQGASVTVDLTYEYVNNTSKVVESRSITGYGSGGVVTALPKPQGDYRSYRATATYNVRIGNEYQWTPQPQTIYYPSPQ